MTTWREWCGKIVFALYLVALVGCGEEGPFDPNSFAGQHPDEVNDDCQRTVACLQLMQPHLLPSSPFESCQETTEAHLERHPEKQAQFLLNYSRCSQFLSCDYFRCAITDAVSFGETHSTKIEYDCQQQIQCELDQATFSGDANAALQDCVSNSVLVLNSATSQTQETFLLAFQNCSTQASCGYVSCAAP